jgi:hypothetical protein
VDEDDIEELLEAVPEELTNEELLEMEHECLAEEEEREKETAGEEKEPLRKFTLNALAEAFADLSKLLKKFENMDPNTQTFSLIERNVLLTSKSMMKKETNQANHQGQISERE